MLKEFTVLLTVILLCTSCSSRNKEVFNELIPTPETTDSASLIGVVVSESPSATESPTQTPEPTENIEGKLKSPLTGEYIDERRAMARPIAVVINNRAVSLPQSGISAADIYYEVLTEGDITRIVAVFQGADSKKIGSIRSARDYFLLFALDNGAILAHHGGSEDAYSKIQSLKIDNVDGMKYDGTLYWRDQARVSKGLYEHSSYSNSENLLKAAEKNGLNTKLPEDYKPLFSFYEGFTVPSLSIESKTIRIPFSQSNGSYFTYDVNTKLYGKYEYGEAQIDEETGEQLTVTNVIVQSADMWQIKGDTYGHRAAELVGSGTGYLATGGVYIPIKWSKASEKEATKWYNADGSELLLNKGKTWICVLQSEKEPTFE